MDQAPQEPNTCHQLLEALELVLGEETLALRKLDGPELDRLAEQKREIEQRLAKAGPLEASDRGVAERVRYAAVGNQMLLVHARDTVRGLIATLTGAPPMEHPLARQSTAPVRLDVKV